MEEIEAIRKKRMEELLRKANEGEASSGLQGKLVKLTDSNFQEALRQNPLLAVDFWAAWCGPCRMIAPVIEELTKEYAGSVVFGKLNTDENRATSMRYGIMSIPTLLLFKSGKEVDRIVGAVPKQAIKDRLERILR